MKFHLVTLFLVAAVQHAVSLNLSNLKKYQGLNSIHKGEEEDTLSSAFSAIPAPSGPQANSFQPYSPQQSFGKESFRARPSTQMSGTQSSYGSWPNSPQTSGVQSSYGSWPNSPQISGVQSSYGSWPNSPQTSGVQSSYGSRPISPQTSGVQSSYGFRPSSQMFGMQSSYGSRANSPQSYAPTTELRSYESDSIKTPGARPVNPVAAPGALSGASITFPEALLSTMTEEQKKATFGAAASASGSGGGSGSGPALPTGLGAGRVSTSDREYDADEKALKFTGMTEADLPKAPIIQQAKNVRAVTRTVDEPEPTYTTGQDANNPGKLPMMPRGF